MDRSGRARPAAVNNPAPALAVRRAASRVARDQQKAVREIIAGAAVEPSPFLRAMTRSVVLESRAAAPPVVGCGALVGTLGGMNRGGSGWRGYKALVRGVSKVRVRGG
jgi:hypothetical protein